MKSLKKEWMGMLVVTLLASLACSLFASPATPQPEAIYTAAAQTMEAQLTQTAFASLIGSLTPPAATSPSVEASPTLTEGPPTATESPTPLPPTPTNTQVCDQARYIKDVTVPDGTKFAPNQTFTKTWRIQNTGTCTWSGYSLVFDSGDAMGGSASIPIGTVNPGQEIDLSVALTAPASEGKYRGYWRIRNASGVLLPVIGGYSMSKFVLFCPRQPAWFPPVSTSIAAPRRPSGLAVVHLAPEVQCWLLAARRAMPMVLSFIVVAIDWKMVHRRRKSSKPTQCGWMMASSQACSHLIRWSPAIGCAPDWAFSPKRTVPAGLEM